MNRLFGPFKDDSVYRIRPSGRGWAALAACDGVSSRGIGPIRLKGPFEVEAGLGVLGSGAVNTFTCALSPAVNTRYFPSRVNYASSHNEYDHPLLSLKHLGIDNNGRKREIDAL